MIQAVLLIGFEAFACVVVACLLLLATATLVTASTKTKASFLSWRLRRRTKVLLRSRGVSWAVKKFATTYVGDVSVACPSCKDTVYALSRDVPVESYHGRRFAQTECLGFCCLRCGLVSSNVFFSDSWRMVEQLFDRTVPEATQRVS